MRILHIVTAFPRFPDDVISPWLVELLKRLQARGHEVEVFTSAYKGGGGGEFAGIPVHRFRYFPAAGEDLTHEEGAADRMGRSWRYKILPGFYLAAGLRAIWRLCRARRYDIIHVHWPLPHMLFGWAAQRALGRKAHARIVTTWYGIELRWVKSSLRFLKGFVRRALRTSDEVVAISSATAREIASIAAVPVRVIPYGIGFAEVTAAPRKAAGTFTILFVGGLLQRKGVTYLVDAVRRLPPRLRWKLVLVGEGPDLPALETQARAGGIADRVEFRGQVPDAELHAAYAAANVFVLPAVVDERGDTEGLGVVLLEAMNYHLPVIGSSVGGITDIVLHEQTGLAVPEKDPQALADALLRIADDPALAARLAAAGYRHAQEHFSWPAITDQWEECYAAAGEK
jgi:glycosyltransferase involved in cell wall biosynthesis